MAVLSSTVGRCQTTSAGRWQHRPQDGERQQAADCAGGQQQSAADRQGRFGVDPDSLAQLGRMTPGALVRRQRRRRIRALTNPVVVRLTPLHEPERLSSLSTLWASPCPLRCRLLTGKLRWLVVQPPASSNSWLSLTSDPLPVAAAYEWAVLPQCGAVVLFSGTVRDHATDEQGVLRDNVESLTYEAYEAQVVPRFEAIDAELRQRWPETGRVVLLHRTGSSALGESSVIAVVSAPHRAGSLRGGTFRHRCAEVSAPIWKHEVWSDGADWGLAAGAPVDACVLYRPASGRRNAP